MSSYLKEIIITCGNSDETFRLAKQIHDQLEGHESYKEQRIELEFSPKDRKIYVVADSEFDIPSITLNLSKPKD